MEPRAYQIGDRELIDRSALDKKWSGKIPWMAEKWPRLHIVDIPVFDSKDGTKLEDEEEYKIQARKLFHSLNVRWMQDVFLDC